MRKLLLPLTLLILLISCRTGDVNKEPWQEGITLVTGLLELDYKDSLSIEGHSVKMLIYLKNSSTGETKSLTTEYNRIDKSFYLFNRTVSAASYTFTGGQITIFKNIDNRTIRQFVKFNFNYNLEIVDGVINNLGTITLSEERGAKIRYDLAIPNKGYEKVTDYYYSSFNSEDTVSDKWHNTILTEGEQILEWSPLMENLPDKVTHEFDDLEITISYQAEAEVNEVTGLKIVAKSSSLFILTKVKAEKDLEIKGLSHTSSVKVEGLKSEREVVMLYKIVPRKSGLYIIDTPSAVYDKHEYKLPPIAITVKENNNDDD